MQSTTNNEVPRPANRTATAFCANPAGKRKKFNRRGNVSKGKK